MNKIISYPDSGHNNCLSVEEKSFWFKIRNQIISVVFRRFKLDGSFADVGGGNGVVSSHLKKKFPEITFYLIEPGQEGCKNAKKRGLENVINNTLDRIAPEIKFDNIGLFDVLEHIDNPLSLLNDCYNRLNSEGRIFITVPAYNFLWSFDDTYTGHFRRYTRSDLIKTMKESNFHVKFSSYFFVSLVPLIFLLKTIPYLFGKKRQPSLGKDHQPSIFSRLLEKLLILDLSLLSRGLMLPIGSSIILCAKKK